MPSSTIKPSSEGSEAVRERLRRLEEDERELIEKAKRAKQVGDEPTLDFIKANLKRVVSQRRVLTRQLQMIEGLEEQAPREPKTSARIDREIDEGLDEIERELGEA